MDDHGTTPQDGEAMLGASEFVDTLTASIAQEKARVEASLASHAVEVPGSRMDVSSTLDDLNVEVSEVRGRVVAMQSSLDALLGEDPARG